MHDLLGAMQYHLEGSLVPIIEILYTLAYNIPFMEGRLQMKDHCMVIWPH